MRYDEFLIKASTPELLMRALLDSSVTYAGKLIGKKSLAPATMILSENGVTFATHDFSSEREKRASFDELQKLLEETRAVAYCTVCEAWAVRRGKNDGLPVGSLSKESDRFEVVTASAVTTEDVKVRSWKIERADDGTCARLERFGEDRSPMNISPLPRQSETVQ